MPSKLALILCLCPLLAFFPQLPPDPILEGIIDFHAHAAPDSVARSVDVVELAQKARQVGMRGFVIKNHYIPTAGYAYLARKLVPGLEVFGGVVLNLAVGGINGPAVESMTAVRNGFGRVVWMPTFDAENHVRFFKENRPFVRVSESGQLLPEVLDLLEIIAQKNLILETGHSSAAECLLLIQAARQAGVKHIIVTHAMMNPINMSVEQQKKAAGMGAFLEHAFVGTLQGPRASLASMRGWKGVSIGDYAAAIKAVGAQHCILSSDLGQAGNPIHTDGLRHFITALKQQGIGDHEIDLMTRKNPARLLEL
ncbi:DUF6282 family protein [Acidobacteria bacterium AH-259-O06]|nr:DUF6282 family protein [Acidobacteria bacterium AH-259-O06]